MTTPSTTHAVSADDLALGLGRLGLPAEESRAYVLLQRRGPSLARDLVAPLGLPRTKAYRILQGLMRRGFASATLRRPSMYVAADPERAFDLLRVEAQTRLEAVRAESERLRPLLALLPQEGERRGGDDAAGLFRVVQGLRDVRRLAAGVAGGARNSLDVMDAPPPTNGFLRSWWPMASSQIGPAPGVTLRMLLEAPPGPPGCASPSPFEVRRLESFGATRLLLVDRTEAVLDVSGLRGDTEPVAMWVCRSRFVRALGALFDLSWRLADPGVQLLAAAPTRDASFPLLAAEHVGVDESYP